MKAGKMILAAMLVSAAALRTAAQETADSLDMTLSYQDGRIHMGFPEPECDSTFDMTFTGIYGFRITDDSGNSFYNNVSLRKFPLISGWGTGYDDENGPNGLMFFNPEKNLYIAVEAAKVYTNAEPPRTDIDNMDSRDNVSAVMALNPVRFRYRSGVVENAAEDLSGVLHYGFVAQEVESVIPEAVEYDGNGYRLLNSDALLAVTLGAVGAMADELENTEKELASLSDAIVKRYSWMKVTGCAGGQIECAYRLPESCKATLILSDGSGVVFLRHDCIGTGDVENTALQYGNVRAGIYLLSMVTEDGGMIGSTSIILE